MQLTGSEPVRSLGELPARKSNRFGFRRALPLRSCAKSEAPQFSQKAAQCPVLQRCRTGRQQVDPRPATVRLCIDAEPRRVAAAEPYRFTKSETFRFWGRGAPGARPVNSETFRFSHLRPPWALRGRVSESLLLMALNRFRAGHPPGLCDVAEPAGPPDPRLRIDSEPRPVRMVKPNRFGFTKASRKTCAARRLRAYPATVPNRFGTYPAAPQQACFL